MLASLIYTPVEILLNQLLAQDPAAAAKLQELCPPDSQPVVSLLCTTTPKWQLHLLLDGSRLQLRSVYDGPVAASVSASASAFIRLVSAENTRTALFSPDIVLAGDTHLVQALFETLRNLDFDWEYYMESVTGGVLTHQLSKAVDSARQWSGEFTDSMRSNFQEYLHEESGLLPQQSELEEFYTGVDELRLRIDRLEARLQRLL
jgi:ubiquinone biosynthesis protein UbiJ